MLTYIQRALFVAVVISVIPGFCAGQTFQLPCEMYGMPVPAASGTIVWYRCETPHPGLSEGQLKDHYWKNFDQTLYALDLATGLSKQLLRVNGVLTLSPSPAGTRLLVERIAERRLVLFEDARSAPQPLPFGFAIWNYNGSALYFPAESAQHVEGDTALGRYDLLSHQIRRVLLSEPSEEYRCCTANGHVFVGSALSYDRTHERAHWLVDEYDASLKLLRRHVPVPIGDFSSHCLYVASAIGSHGPVPWTVSDAATGKELAYFFFADYDDRDQYAAVQWNPKKDELLLVDLMPANSDANTLIRRIYNVRTREWIGKWDVPVAWAADGEHLLVPRSRNLAVEPLPEY